LSDATYESTINGREKVAWQAFGDVFTTVLGNKEGTKLQKYCQQNA
jgi:hypothetical protein